MTRAVAAKGTLVVASLAMSLLALEFGLRCLHGLPLAPAQNLLLARVDRFVKRGEQIHDPTLGWVLKSYLQTVRPWAGGRRYTVTSGEAGVRMNQGEIRPVPRHAILAVGDSFTFGAEVGDAGTWPAQLEQRLGEAVLNAGVGGYGTDQIVLRAESLLETLAPKLVIVSFLAGDVLRTQQSVFGGGSKPYFTAEDGQLRMHNVPVPAPDVARAPELRPLRRWLGYSYLVEWTMSRLGVDLWFAVPSAVHITNDPVAVSCLLLERLKQRLDAQGTRTLFTMQWQSEDLAHRERRIAYAASVLECAVAAGIQTVDTWDAIKAAGNRDGFDSLYNIAPGNLGFMHMSEGGNALIASLLANAVRDSSFVVVPKAAPMTPAVRLQLPVLGADATVAELEVVRDAASGPDGARTATLIDDRGDTYGLIYQDVPVKDDTATHTLSIALKAGSSPLAHIKLTYLGGTEATHYAFVDTASMTANGDGTIGQRALGDGWIRFTLAGPNNGSGNRVLRVHLYARHGEAFDVGSIYFDHATLDP